MTPDVVVDIGNSRMKWGRCADGRVVDVIRLPLDDPHAWNAELAKLPSVSKWAVASVNPTALHRFVSWSSNHGNTVVFEKYTDLPIRLNVDEPGKVGLDRLCGAVAAKAMVPAGTPAITVDVGTAVTVNVIDAEGVFQGGAIMPGPRLMGRALHEFTAKLPLIDLSEVPPETPGKNTGAAIRIGVFSALMGGMNGLVSLFTDECSEPPWLFITGGGHHLLEGYRSPGVAQTRIIPTLTLEGIRIAAEALP
jgi:type III pantothenate kinase